MHACTDRGCPAPTGAQAHCGGANGCHKTFTAVCHFDAHRTGAVDRRKCVGDNGGGRMVIPPATPDGSPYSLWFEDGLWSTDEGHAERRAAAERMAKARAAKAAV